MLILTLNVERIVEDAVAVSIQPHDRERHVHQTWLSSILKLTINSHRINNNNNKNSNIKSRSMQLYCVNAATAGIFLTGIFIPGIYSVLVTQLQPLSETLSLTEG